MNAHYVIRTDALTRPLGRVKKNITVAPYPGFQRRVETPSAREANSSLSHPRRKQLCPQRETATLIATKKRDSGRSP